MKNKNLLIILAAAAVIIGGTTLGFLFYEPESPNPEYTGDDDYSWESDPRRLAQTESVVNVTLLIDFSNGTVLNYTEVTLTNHYTSGFDLVVTKAASYKIQIFQYPAGASFYITEINGLHENLGQGVYWQYFINNQYSQIGSNLYKLQDNDVIRWVYGSNLQ